MPSPDAPPLTRWVVLRATGFGVAILLGAVAVWLIVIADSTKSMRLGVLAGIWGALLGAYSMFGSRRHGFDADEAARRSSISDVPVLSTAEIAVRSHGDVERVAEAAARRAFEDRLEQLLRRELSREVSDLRSEIARLRQDLLDKVGGQLRLERIETTRVIGSDLEALQHEVRQLKHASETGTLHELGLGVVPLRKVVEPAKVRPVSRPTAEAEDEITPARSADEPVPAPAENAAPAEAAPAPAATAPRPEAASPTPPRAPVDARAATAPSNAPKDDVAAPGASANGASSNGAANNGAARRADPPAPVETTGPIRVVSPAGHGRSQTPPRQQPAAAAPAPAARPALQQPAERPANRTPDPDRTAAPAAAAPSRPAAAAATPTPATPAPAPEPATPTLVAPPAPAKPAASADPFASLPRITPFTEFELDPIEPAPAPSATPPQASPVAPPSPAYTGRRRRTDAEVRDAGRHSRTDAGAPYPDAAAGRRRAADDADDDVLSRLLARGSAER